MQPIHWIILCVALLIIEFSTWGLTTVWFAGGALAAFFLALAGMHIAVQIGAFVAISVLLVLFTRPIAAKWLNSRTTKTNAESVVGREVLVTRDIDNARAEGQVQVDGVSWTARSAENEVISAGKMVRVIEIQGVKLIVKPI